MTKRENESEQEQPEKRVKTEEEEKEETEQPEAVEQGETMFQLRVSNLKRCGMKDFKKFLDSLKLNQAKTRELAESASLVLEKTEFKSQQIKVESIGEQKKREFKPRSARDEKERNDAEGEEGLLSPSEKLANQVTPLWLMDYPSQLAKKQAEITKFGHAFKRKMIDFTRNKDVSPENKKSLDWVIPTSQEHKGLLCPLDEIVASPVIDEYRSKVEFTIGKDLDGNPTVGFLLGLYKDGVTAVLSPEDSKHVHPVAKKIAAVLQEYVRSSDLPVYDRVTKEGFYRLALVRTQTTGETMLIVQVNPKNVSEEALKAEKAKMASFLLEKCELTTLLFQESTEVFNGFTDKSPVEVVHGPGYVKEVLLGTNFQISPFAFFQVNSAATELLYSTVRNWCGSKDKKTLLLDLCCGTGTIGQLIAPSVAHVVGVEIIEEAIKDARINAENNGISNVTYVAEKVEAVTKHGLGKFIFPKKTEEEPNPKPLYDDVIAVLDPPRAGVHKDVIRAIRECKLISRVVYVSCDANAAMQNFLDLCRPPSNKFPGPVFRPVRMQGFDLFPHTKHFELVIEFVRQPKLEI